ncbi:MAG: NADP-dependent phosphogluconate dehydrogenase [Armatimonadetes bacterium]|nr:NADP-dependent phosphogluconate dehydrogenase [Armatimonadota bacterium]
MQYEFGMIGLGTMGRNLLLNLADHGEAVAGLDLDASKVELLKQEGTGKPVEGFTDAKAFMASLRTPRVVMMLVPAGPPVDKVIESLSPYLEKGDLVIDGGNSFFRDTERRFNELGAKGLAFFGIGVSGGEKGARFGPSMMAGGPAESYERMRPLLEKVAAKADDGEPCVALFGPGAAGHYVKMVHNGIEYALMQSIAEVYDLLRRQVGMNNPKMADIFEEWSTSEIGGFLLQITSTVLRKRDPETGLDLVDLVKDGAKSKGTGKWTSQDAMDLHVAVPSVDAAVSARDISALFDERHAAASILKPSEAKPPVLSNDQLKGALAVTMVAAYAQGMNQLRAAGTEYGYGIDVAKAAAVWRAGCIIRSELLGKITQAYRANAQLANLLVAPGLSDFVLQHLPGMRAVISGAVNAGIPVPALSASLSYVDGYGSSRLPANLIQAQRDFFGAHTYERLDQPGVFHTDWSES